MSKSARRILVNFFFKLNPPPNGTKYFINTEFIHTTELDQTLSALTELYMGCVPKKYRFFGKHFSYGYNTCRDETIKNIKAVGK